MGLCLRRICSNTPGWGGRFRPESVAAFNRNQWQPSTGIDGRFRPESVAIFDRNTQEFLEIKFASAEGDVADKDAHRSASFSCEVVVSEGRSIPRHLQLRQPPCPPCWRQPSPEATV